MRFRLQKKERRVMPNILGNKSMPVYTYRWVDLYASDDREALEDILPKGKEYRIIDTRPNLESE